MLYLHINKRSSICSMFAKSRIFVCDVISMCLPQLSVKVHTAKQVKSGPEGRQLWSEQLLMCAL